MVDQNRAVNGDVVAVEVLPKTAWIKNYKSMGPALDAIDSEHSDNELELVKETPLMQQINETKLKVTGRVVGVIKKFPKTYGGSILNPDQMTEKTKSKLASFAKANKITESDLNQFYRVFVPYNN